MLSECKLSTILSKSKIISASQCAKRLYLEVNHPDFAEQGGSIEHLLEMGNQVGQLARDLHPAGILVDPEQQLDKSLEQTTELIRSGINKPIFEATFKCEDVLIKADILHIGKKNELVEVKSATSVKDYYIHDLAIQSWVMEGASVSLNKMSVAIINSDFVYTKLNQYEGLLETLDLSPSIREMTKKVAGWVKLCKETLSGDLPNIDMGPQCLSPFSCPFIKYCQGKQPDYPVHSLPRGGKIAAELYKDGIQDIRDIPSGRLTNKNHIRVRDVVISGKTFLDSKANIILSELPYPRYYLDFETISFAVPIWLETRPFEALPFQWSCHIESKSGAIKHKEFLDISGDAPMEAFTDSLIETLGENGPIIVYSSYERRILNEMSTRFPGKAKKISAIIERLFDLLPIARKYYYHPDMHGSWSIKKVLPTIAPEMDYANLEEVHDGTGAQVAYLECINTETTKVRRESIHKNLLKYCEWDTLAMVKIAHYFERQS